MLSWMTSSWTSSLTTPTTSTVGTDQFLNLIVIADEEENQFRWCRDKHEGQPVIQTDPAFENRFREAADADAGMRVRPSPVFKNPIDCIADLLTLRLGL
jgi:hypothetical protein